MQKVYVSEVASGLAAQQVPTLGWLVSSQQQQLCAAAMCPLAHGAAGASCSCNTFVRRMQCGLFVVIDISKQGGTY